MKPDDQLVAELKSLDPDFDEINKGLIRYIELSSRLGDAAQKIANATAELVSIATRADKTGLRHAASVLRFSLREGALLVSDASKIFQKLASQQLALSEKIHHAIN